MDNIRSNFYYLRMIRNGKPNSHQRLLYKIILVLIRVAAIERHIVLAVDCPLQELP